MDTLDLLQIDLFPPVLSVRKVSANSHVFFDGSYYSVPHFLFRQQVIVRAASQVVDILDYNGRLVASHPRFSSPKRKYVTNPSHLPDIYVSFFRHDCYDGAKLSKWAACFGPNTGLMIDTLLDKSAVEEHAYKTCIAVLQLSKKFGVSILESACKAALSEGRLSYRAVNQIAKAEFDRRSH